MTTSNFHVFLPPTLLPLSSFKPDSAISQGLVFHQLPQTSSPSQPIFQRNKRVQASNPTPETSQPNDEPAGPSGPAEVVVEVESWDESVVVNKIPAKRSRDDADELDSVSALPTRSELVHPRISTSRALGARRSSRLSRTSDGLLGVPQYDNTESFMSLNTTVTNSQLSQATLPNWTLPLSKLVTLQSLLSITAPSRPQYGNAKHTIMVCVMAVETLKQLRRKEEKAYGLEGTLFLGEWRVTAPPLEGAGIQQSGNAGEMGCTVKLWDKIAKDWGDGQVRRGDVILLESKSIPAIPADQTEVEYNAATAKDPPTITVNATSKVTILYRTLARRVAGKADYLPPRRLHERARTFGKMLPPPGGLTSRILAEDEALRPDLRLSRSDAGVKKVFEWATWFADWVAGDPP